MGVMATAVNRKQKYFRIEDDTTIPFHSMLDIFGDETDDPMKCIIALIQLPNGKWTGVDLRDFTEAMQETALN